MASPQLADNAGVGVGAPSAPQPAPLPRKNQSRQWRRRLVIIAMLAPTVAGLLVFFAYPLIANIYYSLTRYNLMSAPKWIGLRNYKYLFTQDPYIWQATKNTLWFVGILVPARIVMALVVAGLCARARRAAGVWRTLFYLPALVSPVASVVAFVFLFNPGTGPVNKVLANLGIHGPMWFNSPTWSKPSLVLMGVWVMGDIMIIFMASLLDVPKDQYEAASLDGANGMQKLRYVTFPNIVPVLVFALVTGVIAALQYFTEASVASTVASNKATGSGDTLSTVMGYPQNSLLTYTQWLYNRGFGAYQLGYASALAVVLFLVAGIFLIVFLRWVKAFNPEGAR